MYSNKGFRLKASYKEELSAMEELKRAFCYFDNVQELLRIGLQISSLKVSFGR